MYLHEFEPDMLYHKFWKEKKVISLKGVWKNISSEKVAALSPDKWQNIISCIFSSFKSHIEMNTT